MRRKVKLVNGAYYHVFNKSIAGFRIFNNDAEYKRILNVIRYYQNRNVPVNYASFLRFGMAERQDFAKIFRSSAMVSDDKLVKIIAYCLMPTHVHLVVQQLVEGGIVLFMANILNSYTRYFNCKHKRLGPLWVGRFKNVLVESDEQMLHLTRYVHLNPVAAEIIRDPIQWGYSSYREYLGQVLSEERICCFRSLFDIAPEEYGKFVCDYADDQKQLHKIKHLLLD